MKHIVLGDVHLGKGIGIGKPGQGSGLNSRIKDQIGLLDWVLDQAKQNSAENIFITGDVYDEPRPHPALINFFMLFLKRCEKENVNVHIVAGNHDIMRTGNYTVSALDLVPAIEMKSSFTYKSPTIVQYDGVNFVLMPYRDRRMYEVDTTEKALELLKAEIPTVPNSVLIGHLTIEGSIFVGDEIDDMLNEIFCPVSMFDNFKYTFMGHVHEPQHFNFTNIFNVGSMDRSDYSSSEINKTKYLLIFDSSSMKVDKVAIPVRGLQTISIDVPSGKDSTDFVKHELFMFDKQKNLKDNIVKIEIQLDPDVSNIEKDKVLDYLYNSIGIHHCSNLSESRRTTSIDINDDNMISNTMNPIEAINTYYDKLEIDEEDKLAAKAIALMVNKMYEENKK